MALLIEKNIDVLGDINLSQLYVRLIVNNGPGSTPITVRSAIYSSKNSYDLNPDGNNFLIDEFPSNVQFSYVRETDGSDVLGYAHNKLKEKLSTDIMGQVPVLDPSTGLPTYDPSTGLPITEEGILIPKFAQDSSIFVVDVSI